ncbi:MAG: molybdenum cofactor biosynthesis protein MoaE [Deltaproteobacteria bacterium]|nr:molybdenum cofactor biosynthesis protein MoaE [Deltaproteobacteria bacterium]
MDSVTIVSEPFDAPKALAQMQHGDCCGAQASFLGRVREENNGEKVLGIEYECYVPMAGEEAHRILQEAKGLWPIHRAHIYHRIGKVLTGETSLFVGVMSPHRGESFQALQYIVEEIKKRLPIWKKEIPLAHRRMGSVLSF